MLAVAPVFMKADRLPFISGSAIGRALTNGSIPNFFRVAPNESLQSRTIAAHIRQRLKAKDVFIVDDGSVYSKGLAAGVQSRLKARGVRISRDAVSQKTTDFASVVAKIGPEVDVVFLPWQIAAGAQLFGQQLRQQGGKADHRRLGRSRLR